jgi:hypothetical protein
VRGVPQLYDPTRNTIYVGPPPSKTSPYALNAPHYRFSRGPTAGTYTLHAPLVFITVARGSKRASVAVGPTRAWRKLVIWRTVTVTAAQAKALRHGTAVVRWTIRGKGPQVPRITDARVVRTARASSQTDPADVDPFAPAFRGQILALLGSGQAHVVGHATVDGRDTLEIRSADGHTAYYITPDTYQPVELTTRGTSGGTVTLKDNSALLSLTAQHPKATIDRDVADYNAAEARLFPRG